MSVVVDMWGEPRLMYRSLGRLVEPVLCSTGDSRITLVSRRREGPLAGCRVAEGIELGSHQEPVRRPFWGRTATAYPGFPTAPGSRHAQVRWPEGLVTDEAS